MALSPNHFKRIGYVLPSLAFAGIIFYFSSLEKIDLPLENLEFNDLIFHAAGYFLFGVTLLIAAYPSELLRKEPVLVYAILLAIGMAYALSDEIHQSFVPNRTCSLDDFLADAFGVAIALLGRHLAWRYLNRRIANKE